MRMEQIARYRVAGLKDAKIAELVGLTQAGLAVLVSGQDYKDLENSILTGQVSKLDQALAGKINELRSEVRAAVPAALRTIVEACIQKRDLKTALAAAKHILEIDPDKTFSEGASLNQTAPKVPLDFLKGVVDEADKVAKEVTNLPN